MDGVSARSGDGGAGGVGEERPVVRAGAPSDWTARPWSGISASDAAVAALLVTVMAVVSSAFGGAPLVEESDVAQED